MVQVRRILHVEDDPDIREIANLALAELGGFDVLQCESGAVALSKAEAFAPDVIVLDMMMPGMTGIETLAALRKIPSLAQTPAIFMTSKNVATEHQDVIQNEAAGAIQKPFDPVTLPEQIRRIAEAS
ncbi:response regulator [Shimia abyssi]|uniref:Response regulator receiver domain-containing protein n=1 Tax=Shimia abyssi TaxID=1662395 RepID=A0A2P8FDA4_9RHOB|nr:response regulator [Shimia abyssi]PSL19699.1 response regulator receiver domain-containing protein [Shimia abyssi]